MNYSNRFINMKRFILAILSICALYSCLYAQKASIKVSYDSRIHSYSDDDEIKVTKMLLLTGKEESKYFNSMSQLVDSMTSTPEGKKQLRQIQMAAWVSQGADGSITVNKSKGNAPDKTIYTYVVKDFPKESLKVYDRWANELGTYEEALGEISWKVEIDSVRNILAYDCIMAECDYHGRHWRVWFAPEISVSDGPWKLRGLPGLILLAESDNDICLEATGIEAVDEEIPPMYSVDSYEKVDRKKALADHEYFMNNREAFLKARFGATVKVEKRGKDGSESSPYTLTRHSLETE